MISDSRYVPSPLHFRPVPLSRIPGCAIKFFRTCRGLARQTHFCGPWLVLPLLVAYSTVAGAAVIRFDDLIRGQTNYNFDGDGDGKADLKFSTNDRGGFNTVGPGSNMTFIKEPGLEGTSLLSPDLRVDFVNGGSRNLSLGFALNSSSESGSASVSVYDAKGKEIANQTVVGRYTQTAIGRSSFPEGQISVTFKEAAAYATFNFLSDFGRYIIDDFSVGTSNVYGVFVGVKDKGVNGHHDASNFLASVSKNVPGFKEGILLTGDILGGGGVSNQEIEQAINSLSSKMKAGDTFMFFNSSHGASFPAGPETTVNQGNEFLHNDATNFGSLTDDILAGYLSGMDDIQKWVFLDACHSGGFWGNDNPNDAGDLAKLKNIGLFAASGEDNNTYALGNGEGMFTASLLDGFSVGLNGYMRADKDKNRELTYDELQKWISSEWILQLLTDPLVVFEKAQGDSTPFSRDLWQPMSVASADFSGSLFGGIAPSIGPQIVAEPNTLSLLLVPGAILLARRKWGRKHVTRRPRHSAYATHCKRETIPLAASLRQRQEAPKSC